MPQAARFAAAALLRMIIPMARNQTNPARPQEIIQADREHVARMIAENRSLRDMLAWFQENGRPEHSLSIVRADVDMVRKGWAKSGLASTVAILNEELDANANLLRHAWDEYRARSADVGRVQYIDWTDEERDNVLADDEETATMREEIGIARRERGRQAVAARRQAFAEMTFWWNQITALRAHRAKLLGLTVAGINIQIDNRKQTAVVTEDRPPPKVYIGFNPDTDWPDPPQKKVVGLLAQSPPKEPEPDYVEGEYAED